MGVERLLLTESCCSLYLNSKRAQGTHTVISSLHVEHFERKQRGDVTKGTIKGDSSSRCNSPLTTSLSLGKDSLF